MEVCGGLEWYEGRRILKYDAQTSKARCPW